MPSDDTYTWAPDPRVSPATQEFASILSRRMTCGRCLEACPQVNAYSQFVGPAAMAQV